MRPLALILSSFCLLLLGACSDTNPDTDTDAASTQNQIIKSPNDQRSYRSITLENGLQVMLVSDPDSDKAAASMDVYVGSASDPEDFPGLAHFLEHMLFLGTEKYPSANAYQKFLSEHGGAHNAFTSSEHTNYFFDVSAPHLEGALDRFAQQFTAPLFNEEYVEREVHAVHSEYSSKLKSDGRRYFDALKTTLSAGHPYKHFAVGNLETLKDRDDKKLRDALLEFYAQHYSANIMKLVVLGNEPLSTLEKWATEKFSAIPNKNLAHHYVTQDFFDEDFLPAKLEIQSIMDKRSMSVGFPIPSPSEYKHAQPVSFLANLIGHEGKGSLLSALKAEELVDSLSAGAQFDTQHQAMFLVSMSLTQKGLAQTDTILERLFAYIELMKQKGIKRSYFDEQAQMLKIGFAYQEKSEPIQFVRALSGALQESAPERVLFEPYDLNTFDDELYLGFAKHLRPDNMLVTISANSIVGKEQTRWFKTPYTLSKIEPELIARLTKAPRNDQLAMPEKNIFIPDDVVLLSGKQDEIPELRYQAPGIALWHAVDTGFGTPKANLFVTLRSPETMKSATTLNQIELMVSLLKDALNEYSYPAFLAGLNYELYNHMRGVTIKISGYNDKQLILLERILSGMKNETFKAERFAIIKERLKRSLENEKEQKPYEQSLAKAQRTLLSPAWSPEERLAALAPIQVQDMEAFRKRFFQTLDIAVLSNGNVTQEDGLSIAKTIEQHLLKKADTRHVERSAVLDLDAGTGLFDLIEVEHPDTGFVYLLQGNSRDYREQALFMLLSQALSSDYYTQIRTEKQLGYIVFATYMPVLEVPGLAFIVQSPKSSGPELWQETRSFLADWEKQLASMEAELLTRIKTSLISRLSKKDNKLYDKGNRYWREIDRNNAGFDTREQLIAQVEKIDHDTLLAFYRALTEQAGNRLLVYSMNDTTVEATKNPEGMQKIDQIPADKLQYFPAY